MSSLPCSRLVEIERAGVGGAGVPGADLADLGKDQIFVHDHVQVRSERLHTVTGGAADPADERTESDAHVRTDVGIHRREVRIPNLDVARRIPDDHRVAVTAALAGYQHISTGTGIDRLAALTTIEPGKIAGVVVSGTVRIHRRG